MEVQMSNDTPKKDPQTVTIEAMAQAFAAAMKAAGPDATLLTGMSEHRLDTVRGKFDKPVRQRFIKGKSVETGSTFMMVVLESKSATHPHGRVVRLENYQHPHDAYIPQSQGGRMPDGIQIWQDEKVREQNISNSTPSHMLNMYFKQWRWETFWKSDLARIANGNPLRVEICVDGAEALKTPWEDSTLSSETAA
jgi:hypothetical protein